MSNIYIKEIGVIKGSIGNANIASIYIGNQKVWPAVSLLLVDDGRKLLSDDGPNIAID